MWNFASESVRHCAATSDVYPSLCCVFWSFLAAAHPSVVECDTTPISAAAGTQHASADSSAVQHLGHGTIDVLLAGLSIR